MASPQFGTPTIISYGNASSLHTPPGPPGIDSRLFSGIGLTLAPPNLTRPPKMPLVDRITPKSVPASRLITQYSARARTTLAARRKQVVTTVAAYTRAITARH